jgi:hypothetical protein
MIQQYFFEVKEWISQHRALVLQDELNFRVDEELNIGLIQGKISFVDGSSLHISESLNLEKPSYRFHFRDAHTKTFSVGIQLLISKRSRPFLIIFMIEKK